MPEDKKEGTQGESSAQTPDEQKKAEGGAGTTTPPTGPTTDKDKEFHAESDKTATKITDQMLTSALGPLEVAGMLGSADEVKARQHMLNWDDYHKEYKKPNLNKFPNNEDPFPVDLKIEEFEAHWPNVKLYEVTCNVKAKEAAVAAMKAADAAEKRIVKLENNIATLMRLLFRLGTRVPINCVYYGGQNPNFEKYKGIRCMCDDRITDGQQVQIDQCLYCTRFEPIFGQCYELLNDTGMNVAAILDDNQMSYRDMKDYVANARTEKFMKEHEKTIIPATQNEIETRSSNEFSFHDRWGAGIAMDWTYVPKEEQKTHINWRQSINDDGSNIGRLGSWPYMYDRPNMQGGGGSNSGSGDGGPMKKNIDSMEKYANIEPEQKEAVEAAIAAGKEAAKAAESDDVKNKVACDWQKDIMAALKDKKGGADMLTIASMMFCGNMTDAQDVVNRYAQASQDVGTENPAVVIPAMILGKEVIVGNDKLKPIWEVPLYKPEESSSGGGSGSGSDGKGGKKTRPEAEKLDKSKINDWMYGDALYVDRLSKQAREVGGDINLFPKVAYTYNTLAPLLTNSPYDDGENGFPFTNDTLKDVEVYYTSPYGTRTLDGETKLHRGVDFGAPEGTPFVAAHDGTITAAGDGWGSDDNAICLDHGNGEYSRYLHCSEIKCSKGQQVKKGEVIGKVGNVGHSFGAHLHFEFCAGQSDVTKSQAEPLAKYPKFSVTVGERIPAI